MRSIADLYGYLVKLFAFQDSGGNVKIASGFLGVVIGYLFDRPAELSALIGVGILMVTDLVTGVMAAFKEKRAVTSVALSRTLTKLFGYVSVLIVIGVAERTILESFQGPFMTGSLYVMIATEGLSILENVHTCGIRGFGWVGTILRAAQNQAKSAAQAVVRESEPSDKEN
mgnify:CR=1 FL=1